MSHDTTPTLIAGDAAVLARRYAGALYDLAIEQKQLDAVVNDLRGLKAVVHESAEFKYLAAQPRLSGAQLVKAVEQVATSLGFSKLTASFIGIVAKKRRLGHLSAIIDTFLADVAARRGEFTAEIRSAQALSPAQQEQLATKLGAWAGGKVHLSMRSDASLLGGLTVKLGSRLIDASVKTRLELLERQLKSERAA